MTSTSSCSLFAAPCSVLAAPFSGAATGPRFSDMLISCTGGGFTTVMGTALFSASRPLLSRCSWQFAHQCKQQWTMHGSHGEFWNKHNNNRQPSCSTTFKYHKRRGTTCDGHILTKETVNKLHLKMVFPLKFLTENASIGST